MHPVDTVIRQADTVFEAIGFTGIECGVAILFEDGDIFIKSYAVIGIVFRSKARR
jgi:hypothetical protein